MRDNPGSPTVAIARSAADGASVEEVPWDWVDRGWEDRRRHARKAVVLAAYLTSAGRTLDCLVLDISAGGARLHINDAVDASGTVTLAIDEHRTIAARVVWRATTEIGLQFSLAPEHVQKLIGDILS